MDLIPGSKIWFVDDLDFHIIKQATLVQKYLLKDGKEVW